jgi:hypothetical protein
LAQGTSWAVAVTQAFFATGSTLATRACKHSIQGVQLTNSILSTSSIISIDSINSIIPKNNSHSFNHLFNQSWQLAANAINLHIRPQTG